MNMHIALCLLTRKAFLILVSLAFFTFSASAQRMMKTINDGWDFRKDGETRWQPINLPHTFNLEPILKEIIIKVRVNIAKSCHSQR